MRPQCPPILYHETSNINNLEFNGIPSVCEHMHLELLAHIYYMANFWESLSPPPQPERPHDAGIPMRRLIPDFVAVVTERRRV
ncbi:uncharacterized protein PGRI_005880 [Penicillium griseofulvum]|uniref:Uncharacterized protein n=1 Tax=Penicillium patulum TaxID=5078 RepID=A0A135LX47_PENPA|nr:uncharacterized protein PGRI_005880 [Penicillium griseofulvum]KXG53538.1 hypothetical protein PGRI_005880 [Penicillium griseofulvum]